MLAHEGGTAGAEVDRFESDGRVLASRPIEQVDETDLTDFLAEQNVTVSRFERRYGATGFGRSIYITDPEGNIVELKCVDNTEPSP